MSKMKSILASSLIFAALLESDPFAGSKQNKTREEDIDFTPKEPPVPKGCKKYSFHGGFETIASSEKSALKKYNKWLASQNKKSWENETKSGNP